MRKPKPAAERRTLKPYQRAPAEYAKKVLQENHSPRLFIFKEMGSGKSATLAHCVVEVARWIGHAVVVVPAVVAAAMASEFEQAGFRPAQKRTLPASCKYRLCGDGKPDVFVVSYDSLLKFQEANPSLVGSTPSADKSGSASSSRRKGSGSGRQEPTPFLLAYDESQKLRNVGTFSRSVEMVDMMKRSTVGVMMSGTPMVTDVSDLYAQLFALDMLDGDADLSEQDARDFEKVVCRNPGLYFQKLRKCHPYSRFFVLRYDIEGKHVGPTRRVGQTPPEFANFSQVRREVEGTLAMRTLRCPAAKDVRAVEDFQHRYAARKMKKRNKHAVSRDFMTMSSNASPNLGNGTVRPSPKILDLCAHLRERARYPAIVLCANTQYDLGGVPMIEKALANAPSGPRSLQSRIGKAERDILAQERLVLRLTKQSQVGPGTSDIPESQSLRNLREKLKRATGDPERRKSLKSKIRAAEEHLQKRRANAKSAEKKQKEATRLLPGAKTKLDLMKADLRDVRGSGTSERRAPRVAVLVGGSDHVEAIHRIRSGDADVLITTLTEGYNLSCRHEQGLIAGCIPVSEVHFASPPSTPGDRLQFQARGNRLFSHTHLPPEEQYIQVYTWVTTHGEGCQSYDEENYDTCVTRQDSILAVEDAIEAAYPPA